MFFDKLAKDRKNAMKIPAETILYTTKPEVTNLKWNGREIRNGERRRLYPQFGSKDLGRKADFRCDIQLSKQQLPWPTSTAQMRMERLSCVRDIFSRLYICRRSSKTTSKNCIVETRPKGRIGSEYVLMNLM